MAQQMTTRDDLATYLADTMALDLAAVTEAIVWHREMWGRYEDIDADQLEAIARAVWADLMPATAYPW